VGVRYEGLIHSYVGGLGLTRGIGPPFSGIVLGTLFLLAADLRRHLTPAHPCPVSSVVLVWPVPRGVSVIPRAVSLRVSISQSTGILGIPLPDPLSNIHSNSEWR